MGKFEPKNKDYEEVGIETAEGEGEEEGAGCWLRLLRGLANLKSRSSGVVCMPNLSVHFGWLQLSCSGARCNGQIVIIECVDCAIHANNK